MTSQPKADHLSSSGSMFMMSLVLPSELTALRSTIPTRFVRPKWDAEAAASHTWPSFCSPSPIMHTTRPSSPCLSSPSAIPTETERL